MAALLLSAVGGAAGGALFGTAGAIGGRLIGALAGNVFDRALFGSHASRSVEGPRLSDLDVMSSSEGAPIPRVYGRARLSGQVIWATALEEQVNVETQEEGGGKGLGGGSVTTTNTTYSYFANFAVALCEGPIASVLRVWADGKLLDIPSVAHRLYKGDNTQTADPLIVAKEGHAPAYRGTAYMVFERLPLESFGNRIPQLSFEIVRPIGELERMTRAITLIPGTTEFGYEPLEVTRVMGPGQNAAENRHVLHEGSDVRAAIEELQSICPSLERVALVVAWFGSDLRAGVCDVRPKVDNAVKTTRATTWSVAGLTRRDAQLVSQVEGRPAYGGTPDDQSVIDLIVYLKNRGLKVTLYPFVMMDVPADNALANPYTGNAPQPPYPWRGRITCDPAPGQSGSPDGTASAATQIESFFTGAEWNYRRMVMHYAQLAATAGGVDAFLIGSELRGLTRVRSAAATYPAVTALVGIAGEVKALLGGGTVVTYGADWTEYGAHVVDANEINFPLDPLWASSSIDAVGIDYYAPLSDWRDSATHLDRALADTVYDRDYLAGNLRRGENYDWYYTGAEARAEQARTTISDGLGKPWMFRSKDLWNWWSQPHYQRSGGVEGGSPTGWVPQGKPIWITEIGCPAVDKGPNQPSVFPDPKSSENFYPYFSNASRDDLVQRRMLEAVLTAFDPAFGASEAMNPVSNVYGGRMITASAIHLWTWDARPYPMFPAVLDVWSDGANWETGHWLTGRLGTAPLDALVEKILTDSGIANGDASGLDDVVDGYVVDRPMAPRAMIEPLATAYAFDAAEEGGTIRFRPRGGTPTRDIDEDDLVLTGDAAPLRLTRTQETELPREVSIGFTDAGFDYRRAAITSRRLTGGAARQSRAELSVVTNDAAASRRADIWLQDLWAGREQAEFALPPSALAVSAGDVVAVTAGGRRRVLQIQDVADAGDRAIKARSLDSDVFNFSLAVPRRKATPAPAPVAPVHALLLDLPAIDATDPAVLTRAAIFADPWLGPVAIWRSTDGASFQRAGLATARTIMGETLDDLPSGPPHRFDRHNGFRVRLYGGALSSVTDHQLFAGRNVAAVQRPDGAWEVLQFANAELVGANTYYLSRLLRGQAGSEWAIADLLDAGAPFVVLDTTLNVIARGSGFLEQELELRFIAASRDYGDPATQVEHVTPSAVALKPLAPVHLEARRSDAGLALSWIRRTRFEGDSWAAEPPLGEEREAYEVDVLSGSSVVRTLSATGPDVLYPAAEEIADFGALQSSLSVAVYQLSSTVGRGFAAHAVLTP